jgi:hypothetical protein
MSKRPNYVLKLADGTERVFTPLAGHDFHWQIADKCFSDKDLETLGATPVPQEEPKVRYCHYFQAMCEAPTVPVTILEFKSHKDAENYRLRCESIGPEWRGNLLRIDISLEHRQEWLDKFGKAWGLK